MNAKQGCCAIAAAVLAAGPLGALAAGKVDVGQREYMNSCAVCHGANLKTGAYVDFCKVTPSDLTQLAKKNGGVFPFERVYRMIDGREPLKGHGTREMPIWGQRFSVEGASAYDDYPFDAEALVRARILALIDYLNRMQAK
jgi:mono/diheme cytochrome c family protein